MKKDNTALLVIVVAAVVLIGGGVIYSLNQNNDTQDRPPVTQEITPVDGQDNDQPPVDSSDATNETRVIDGVEVPTRIVSTIEREYPDYIIDDVDRETDDGQVYYEIDLNHRDTNNDSEYKLTYNEQWELVDTKFDED